MKPGSQAQRGASIIELLIALLIASVVFGGAFAVLVSDSKAYRSQTNISEMRTNARSALDFLSRDIRPAGYGLSNLPSNIAVVIANEPTNLTTFSSTAITTRFNSMDVWTTLSDSMPMSSSELKVTTVAGFVEGMRIMIWDSTGAYDWLVVTQVQDSPDHLQHNTMDTTKAYRPEDGTVIGAIDELSYRYVAATKQIERLQSAGTWYVIANNVEFFQIQYWNEDNNEIFPADDATRRAIRKVGVSLRVRTGELDRATKNWRTYSVSTEITPRNMPFLPTS